MRDYAGEMKRLIEAETGGEYVAPLIANRIINRLRVRDNDLLVGWLDLHAAQILTEAIGSRDRSERSYARAVASRSVFSQRAREYERTGDAGALGQFLQAKYVLADGTRRVLADLTHEDLMYVAGEYRKRAKSNSFEGAFFLALAAKVDAGTVGEVLNESQIVSIRRQLVDQE